METTILRALRDVPWIVIGLASCGARSGLVDRSPNGSIDASAGVDGPARGSEEQDAGGTAARESGAADSAGCGSTDTDPSNCGRCGHDCQGGACAAGVCQPVKLGSATGCAIALDATHVYWPAGDAADHVQLTRQPLLGDAPVALAVGGGDVTGMAVDAVSLYWTEADQRGSTLNQVSSFAKKVPLGGGPASTLAMFSLLPSAIAVREANVYVTTRWIATFDPADQTPNGAVLTFPAGGGTPSALATGLQNASSVAVDAERVYWAEQAGAGCTWGCVMAVPLGGGAPTTLTSNAATTQQGIPSMALNGTDIYWTNQGVSSTVVGRPLTGGSPVTIASNQNEPRAIAVDATSVYWSTTGPDAVMKAPRHGGPVTKIADSSCGGPCAIAVGDATVYWIACNTLMRIAKSP